MSQPSPRKTLSLVQPVSLSVHLHLASSRVLPFSDTLIYIARPAFLFSYTKSGLSVCLSVCLYSKFFRYPILSTALEADQIVYTKSFWYTPRVSTSLSTLVTDACIKTSGFTSQILWSCYSGNMTYHVAPYCAQQRYYKPDSVKNKAGRTISFSMARNMRVKISLSMAGEVVDFEYNIFNSKVLSHVT